MNGGEFMIQMLSTYFEALRRDERGQGLVEYALIIALVSVALILVLGAVTGSITGVFEEIQDALDGAVP
jgi:pilus assembly protein Flp/PilA